MNFNDLRTEFDKKSNAMYHTAIYPQEYCQWFEAFLPH